MVSIYEQLSGLEKGLLKDCSWKKHTIKSLTRDLESMTTISSRTIGKLGGIAAVLEYRAEIMGWDKAYFLTKIGDYTNKRGQTSRVHYNENGKYIGSLQKLGEEPVWCLCWTQIHPDTIHLWGIKEDDKDFKLYPIKK